MRDARPEEQAAMREIWPNGLPPGSLNERIENEMRAAEGYSEEELDRIRSAADEAEARYQAEDDEVRALRASYFSTGFKAGNRAASKWQQRQIPANGVVCVVNKHTGRKVLLSVGRESDGRVWVHASISRQDRATPTYDDLKLLHQVFLRGRLAYQVFAPPDEHYDNPHGGDVLHLFAPLTGSRPTPDFRSKAGTI